MPTGDTSNRALDPDPDPARATNSDITNTNPTADYRPYPKGPNFGLIVGLFCATILIALIAAWLVLRSHPRMVPEAHGPQPSKSLSTPSKNGH